MVVTWPSWSAVLQAGYLGSLSRSTVVLVACHRYEGEPVANLLATSSHNGMVLSPQGEKGEVGEKGDPGAEVGQPNSSM